MVAWTARQALMLEMIWPLPWEVSVPAKEKHSCQPDAPLNNLCLPARGSFWRWGSSLTFLEDDDGGRLPSERHVGGCLCCAEYLESPTMHVAMGKKRWWMSCAIEAGGFKGLYANMDGVCACVVAMLELQKIAAASRRLRGAHGPPQAPFFGFCAFPMPLQAQLSVRVAPPFLSGTPELQAGRANAALNCTRHRATFDKVLGRSPCRYFDAMEFCVCPPAAVFL